MSVDILYGVFNMPAWGYVLTSFLMIQVTMLAVTLYLHRDAAHRAVDLHPALRHFFRLWIWMTSGMITGEWVAVHRKHHAFSDQPQDPHSPVQQGLRKILLEGAEVYRVAARDPATFEKYGRGTPEDWLERHVYRAHRNLGITLFVVMELVLFGVPGIIMLAVQLAAMPVMAAGVINGLGHAVGYRNFECDNAARNLVPWGLLSGGEELHNNHHAFPSSARFSIRPWEFDIGWACLRVLSALHLAHVKKVAPAPLSALARPAAAAAGEAVDLETVSTIIATRMHVLRAYARLVTLPVLKAEAARSSSALGRYVARLLVRHPDLLDPSAKVRLQRLLAEHATLRTVQDFRDRLATLWSGSIGNNERLIAHLRIWVQEAERSGIVALEQFAARLAAVRAQSART